MADMTESQRLWRAWLDAYSQVVDALPDKASVLCPSHADGTVQVAFTGDLEERIGYVIVWCGACLEGIALDRLHVPEGVPMLPFDASEEQRAAVVPPNVRLLAPDLRFDTAHEASS